MSGFHVLVMASTAPSLGVRPFCSYYGALIRLKISALATISNAG